MCSVHALNICVHQYVKCFSMCLDSLLRPISYNGTQSYTYIGPHIFVLTILWKPILRELFPFFCVRVLLLLLLFNSAPQKKNDFKWIILHLAVVVVCFSCCFYVFNNLIICFDDICLWQNVFQFPLNFPLFSWNIFCSFQWYCATRSLYAMLVFDFSLFAIIFQWVELLLLCFFHRVSTEWKYFSWFWHFAFHFVLLPIEWTVGTFTTFYYNWLNFLSSFSSEKKICSVFIWAILHGMLLV